MHDTHLHNVNAGNFSEIVFTMEFEIGIVSFDKYLYRWVLKRVQIYEALFSKHLKTGMVGADVYKKSNVSAPWIWGQEKQKDASTDLSF